MLNLLIIPLRIPFQILISDFKCLNIWEKNSISKYVFCDFKMSFGNVFHLIRNEKVWLLSDSYKLVLCNVTIKENNGIYFFLCI